MSLTTSRFKGQFCPVIVCDHCSEVIQDTTDGNYQWMIDVETGLPVTGEVFFTHKKYCMKFELTNSEEMLELKVAWGATDLQTLPVYLVHNLRINWKQAQEQANFLGHF